MTDGAEIRSRYQDFLTQPSGERFVSLRNAIIESANYDPYTDSLNEIQRLIDDGEYDEAGRRLDSCMPNLMLSPRAHLVMAALAELRDADSDRSDLERSVARACLEAIAGTGDGSRQRPYQVLRATDEHDLLTFLGREGDGQRFVHDGDRHFEVLSCGGEEIWFDISDAYNWLQSRRPDADS